MLGPYSIKSPVCMEEGVDARPGMVPGNLASFSLPFSSVIVSDSGSSFLKAVAVALSESVAAKTFSPIVIKIVLPIDCSLSTGCATSEQGQAQASATAKVSDAIEAYWVIRSLSLGSNVLRTVLWSHVPASPRACRRAFPGSPCGSSPWLAPHHASASHLAESI